MPKSVLRYQLDKDSTLVWKLPFTNLVPQIKWNVTQLLLGESNFYFFKDLYCARIGLYARFALQTKEGGKERASRSVKEEKLLPFNRSGVLFLVDPRLIWPNLKPV